MGDKCMQAWALLVNPEYIRTYPLYSTRRQVILHPRVRHRRLVTQTLQRCNILFPTYFRYSYTSGEFRHPQGFTTLFEVLTAVAMKSSIFWHIAPPYSGQKNEPGLKQVASRACSCSSQKSVGSQQTTRRYTYIPEDRTLRLLQEVTAKLFIRTWL